MLTHIIPHPPIATDCNREKRLPFGTRGKVDCHAEAKLPPATPVSQNPAADRIAGKPYAKAAPTMTAPRTTDVGVNANAVSIVLVVTGNRS
jgi:3-oxoacyl-ACP reductase-like protein